MSMNAYQHQSIGTLILPRVLHNVPTWHPWTHDAKWKFRLRNLDNGEQISMGKILAPFDITAVDLA